MRPLTPKHALAIAAASLMLATPGCGSDSDEETTPTESEARADFIASADAICEATGVEVAKEFSKRLPPNEAPDPSKQVLLAFLTEATLPALENQFQEIAALTPPDGEEDQVQAIIDAANQAIAESQADPNLLLVAQGGPTPFDEANRLQQEFGFEVCGSD